MQTPPRLKARTKSEKPRSVRPCSPSAYYERVVDVMEELVRFTWLARDAIPYLVDRYSERRESADMLSKRVNLRSI